MEDHWAEATELLDVLVKKAQYQDDNGMDLSFTLSQGKVDGSNDPDAFMNQMQHQGNRPRKYGHTDMKTKLGRILFHYLGEVSKGQHKNLSVVVLTDGVWEGMNNKNGVEEMVVNFINQLTKTKPFNGELLTLPVSIQFIRFGDDPEAISRLTRLDKDLKYRGIPSVLHRLSCILTRLNEGY
jgi:hypothetical protein